MEASEIRLRLSPEYNTTYLTPAWTIIESFQTVKEVHSHYDTTRSLQYLSMLQPLAVNFYHSVDDFDPKTLLDNIKSGLAGEECHADLVRVGEAIDVAATLMYYIINGMEAIDGDCNVTEWIKLFDNGLCHQYFQMAETSPKTCDVCSPSVIFSSTSYICDIFSPLCICCYAGYLKGKRMDLNDMDQLDLYLQYSYQPYIGKLRPVNENIEACNTVIDYLVHQDMLLPTVAANIDILDSENVTYEDYVYFMNETYNQIYSNFSTVNVTMFKVIVESQLLYIVKFTKTNVI